MATVPLVEARPGLPVAMVRLVEVPLVEVRPVQVATLRLRVDRPEAIRLRVPHLEVTDPPGGSG